MNLTGLQGRDTDLISLGLSSISAIEVIGRLEERYQINLSLADLMIEPNVKHIKERVEALKEYRSREGGTSSPEPLEEEKAKGSSYSFTKRKGSYFPLTKTQLTFFSECEAHPDSVQYNIPGYYAFPRAEMEIEALQGMIQKIVGAHEACRIRFFRKKDVPEKEQIEGVEVYQRISEEEPSVRITHLDTVPWEEGDQEGEKAYFQKKVVPFSLVGESLVRVELVETKEKLYLFTDFHHILSDGFSLHILAEDLNRLLEGREIQKEVLSFREYALLEAGGAGGKEGEEGAEGEEEREKKERRYFEGLLSQVESFAYPYRLEDVTGLGHQIRHIREMFTCEEISRFCTRQGVTPSSYFHSALLLTLFFLPGKFLLSLRHTMAGPCMRIS